jgi:hypothetical protein
MADFPTLAEVAEAHRGRERGMVCDEGELWCDACKAIVDADEIGTHIQAEWVKARTIETAEQLDALPVGSVIGLGTGCGLYEKDTRGDWGFPPGHRAYLMDEAWAAGTTVRLLFHPEVDR